MLKHFTVGSPVRTFGAMDHPWRRLRGMAHVTIHFTEFGDGRLAASDGRDTIWLDPRQRQAQRRSSLAHELEHLARGHRGCQPPAIERQVEEVAARRLIDLDSLLRTLAWSDNEAECADDLGVDVAMLKVRLQSLTDDELRRVRRLLEAREEAS